MQYTFSTPISTTTFIAEDDIIAGTIARSLTKTFNVDKSLCKLLKHKPEPKVAINQFKLATPQGPATAIPILIEERWFTPNGMPIHDIAKYKARMRQNALPHF